MFCKRTSDSLAGSPKFAKVHNDENADLSIKPSVQTREISLALRCILFLLLVLLILCISFHIARFLRWNEYGVQTPYVDANITSMEEEWKHLQTTIMLRMEDRKFNFKNCKIKLNGEPKSGTTWLGLVVRAILETIHELKVGIELEKTPVSMKLKTDGYGFTSFQSGGKHGIPSDSFTHKTGVDLTVPEHWNMDSFGVSKGKNTCYLLIVRSPLDVLVSTYEWKHAFREEDLDSYLLHNVEAISKWIHNRFAVFQKYGDGNPWKVFTIFYNDMVSNFQNEIRALSQWLGMELTESEIENVRRITDFQHMKEMEQKNELPGRNRANSRVAKVRGDHPKINCAWRRNVTEEVGDKLESAMLKYLVFDTLKEKFKCNKRTD